jgi:hypothetical protein
LDMVAAGGKVIAAARAMGCALRGVVRAVLMTRPACMWIGESDLLQTHLAREDAIKVAPAMGNDHCAHCARRRW